MISEGYDDHTVMAISGHSSTRMLSRYTHPSLERKIGALETFADLMYGHTVATQPPAAVAAAAQGLKKRRNVGGRQEDRTPDLCVANAALSQLS